MHTASPMLGGQAPSCLDPRESDIRRELSGHMPRPQQETDATGLGSRLDERASALNGKMGLASPTEDFFTVGKQ